MTRPLARSNQRIQSKLVNRKPALCPICERYIAPFAGLPVILTLKGQMIEFTHPDCCAADEAPEPAMDGISRS